MKNQLLRILLGLLVISLLLSACGGGDTPNVEEPVDNTTENVDGGEEPATDEVVTIKWLMLSNWPVPDSGFLELTRTFSNFTAHCFCFICLFTQKFKAEFCYIFSAALNFVLLAIGFLAISFSVGRTTFFVKERKTFF